MVVLEALHDHEDGRAEQRQADVDPPHLQVAEAEVRPRQDDGDGGGDQHEGVERGGPDVEQLPAARPRRRAGAQQDQRREERAEEHDLGGEEEPDAELGVVDAGVGARGDVVRDGDLVVAVVGNSVGV